MSMDLSDSLVESIADRPDAARIAAQDGGEDPTRPPAGRQPLDWGDAVDAATARLEESWVRPDATGHMLSSGLADEFAATLCAFGMVAAELDHMHDHRGNKMTGAERTPRTTLD